MSHVINAVFENGVFKPTVKIKLKNKQQVQIQIVSLDDWQKRFNKVLKSIHNKTANFSVEEIEIDREEAIKDVRQKNFKSKINCFQKTPSKNKKIISLKGYIKNIKITDDEINNAKIKNYPTY